MSRLFEKTTLGDDLGLAEGLENVLAIRTTNVTSGEVVAHHEPRVHTIVHCSLGAKLRLATDAGRLLPDQLGEMTPLLEVGHIGRGFTVERRREQVELAVVPHVVNGHVDGTNISQLLGTARKTPHGNVLTVVGITLLPVSNWSVNLVSLSKRPVPNLHVVGVFAGSGSVGSVSGNSGVPGSSGGRVVGSMHVVRINGCGLHVVGSHGAVGGGVVAGNGSGSLLRRRLRGRGLGRRGHRVDRGLGRALGDCHDFDLGSGGRGRGRRRLGGGGLGLIRSHGDNNHVGLGSLLDRVVLLLLLLGLAAGGVESLLGNGGRSRLRTGSDSNGIPLVDDIDLGVDLSLVGGHGEGHSGGSAGNEDGRLHSDGYLGFDKRVSKVGLVNITITVVVTEQS